MPNSLYDPNRITPIIELLNKQWKEHPQMRLGQLISNITDTENIFYCTDEEIKKRLQEFLLCKVCHQEPQDPNAGQCPLCAQRERLKREDLDKVDI